MIDNPTLNSPIMEYDEEQTDALNNIVDYILEEGKDGNTIWEKYKNGNVMLITDKLISIPGNTTTNVKFTLPFDIVSSAEETYVNSILRTASGSVNELRITRAWLSGVREISITVENKTGVQNGVFQTMLKGKYK